MNIHTKDIAEALNIPLEDARKVQTEMEIYYDFDFSESSSATLKKVSKQAAADLGIA